MMPKSRQKPISLSEKWEGQTSLPGTFAVREVLRVLKKTPQIFGEAKLQQTLKNMQALDSKFKATGETFFHPGKNAFETADAFTDIHMNRYRQGGRPSLPALAIHHAGRLGLD